MACKTDVWHEHPKLGYHHFTYNKKHYNLSDVYACLVCWNTFHTPEAAKNCHKPCENCGKTKCKTCATCGMQLCVGCQCCKKCYHKKSECVCCPQCGLPCVCCCACEKACPGCGKVGWSGLCSKCGFEGAHIDSVQKAALMHGLNYRRNLAQDCADYYLLVDMWQNSNMGRAYFKLLEMSEQLAPEFATYLDMAVGGELRYMTNSYHIPAEIEKEYPEFAHDFNWKNDRGLQWQEWTEYGDPVRRAEFAMRSFYWSFRKNETTGKWHPDPDPKFIGNRLWGGGVGGPKWGNIAEVLYWYVSGKINHIAFLDRVWNLQHNGGCALNKVYNVTSEFKHVLNAHGKQDTKAGISFMYKHASSEVRALWRECNKWTERIYVAKPEKQLKLQTEALLAKRAETELRLFNANNLRELVAAADREQEAERQRLLELAEKKINFALARVTKPETMERYVENYKREVYIANTLGTGDYTPPLNSVINLSEVING